MKKFTVRSFDNFEIKGVSKDESGNGVKIAGYANTVTKDRMNDIIVPSAWQKGVANYRNNPILLWQHNSSWPIGRVTDIQIDNKGLYVEAFVSEAAEKQFNILTLIKDGILKAFSVGFRVKDKKHLDAETTTITDVELLEISIVSVPANQDSLFSLKKSFESEDEYKEWEKSLKSEEELVVGTTTFSDHYHGIEIDEKGNGRTTYTSHGHKEHMHEIKDNKIVETADHSHEIKSAEPLTEQKEEISIKDVKEVPVNITSTVTDQISSVTLSTSDLLVGDITTEVKSVMIESDIVEKQEAPAQTDNKEIVEVTVGGTEENKVDLSSVDITKFPLSVGDFVQFKGSRYRVIKRATQSNPMYTMSEVDLQGEDKGAILSYAASGLLVVNSQDLGTNFDIHVIENPLQKELTTASRNAIGTEFETLFNINEFDLYKAKSDLINSNPYTQTQLNQLINLKSAQISEWTDTNYFVAKQLTDVVNYKGVHGLKDLILSTLIDRKEEPKEEKQQMAEQNIDKPIVIDSGKGASKETVKETPTTETPRVEVSAPRVEQLVEKTGQKEIEAVEHEAVNRLTAAHIDELKELRAEVTRQKETISALNNQKVTFQQQTQKAQFTDAQLADAYLVCKALAARNGYHGDDEGLFQFSKVGHKVKAVTSVASFLSNFSTEIQKQMEINLIIAPMFRRMPVDAQNFRIPVADEETDGDVAQFASGTYATGVGDTTNVPTSNQHVIKAVNFTPHKFMATTHIAKDEEEDTLLPLMPFLREATARRMARAVDKSLLRGDGTLTGFTASPTNTITVGGGYASVIKGVVTLAQNVGAQTLVVNTGASTAATPTNIASARAKLGRYGLRVGGDLVYLTTIEGYNELVQTADFRTVDTFGPQATYHTGVIGSVYGIPVQVTEFLDNKGSSANLIGALVYKPGFLIAERRQMLVESQYEPRQQVTAIYLSSRWDMHALTTDNTNGALNSTYTMACILSSS